MARYELIERIGVGGMAEIFRGKAVAGGGFEKPVAIKRILPHLSQDKRFVELLITEAKTLSQLRHRNVVQIYDVGLGDDGQYFLVMEYVDGVDLGALFEAFDKAGLRLPLEVALHIAGEVCEALDHAHRARGEDGRPLGLVHRDVTPSNILLSRSGEVKLTDFGIAKRMEEATGHGGVRGKFAYISPEQAMNAHVDARSDVYSLGVVLYEMALGKRLYSHLADFDALRAVREARRLRLVDEAPEVDRELARILDSALDPQPADRFPSAGNFGSTLRTFRYALDSSIGDPAIEIARLVDAHRRGRIEEEGASAAPPPQREPTVVRIATAAGFGASFVADDAGTSRIAPGDLFDDEETRAVAPHILEEAMTKSLAFDDVETHPAASGVVGLRELADAETRVMAPGAALGASAAMARAEAEPTRPRAKTPQPRRPTTPPPVPASGRAGPAVGAAADRSSGALADGVVAGASSGALAGGVAAGPSIGALVGGEPGRFDRAPTPTVRDVFYRGEMLDDGAFATPQPGASPRPAVDDGRMSAGRRRAILIAGSACIACAVVAFVVVGVLLGDKSGAAAVVAPDAAPPPVVDAAPPPPPDAAPPPPKKKPVKKKPAAKKPPVKKKPASR
jgi:hypothetical protein